MDNKRRTALAKKSVNMVEGINKAPQPGFYLERTCVSRLKKETIPIVIFLAVLGVFHVMWRGD